MIPQETTFTIGQFAAIHGIHKKTLMWYDQVGLLSPAFVGENGYRYYSYRQSARLETILMLRALEVSIPEIKTFLSHRSAGELRRLLETYQRGRFLVRGCPAPSWAFPTQASPLS